MSNKLQAYFDEYADCHRHPMNRLTHKIAIPLIVFHILAMLHWVKLFTIPGTAFVLSLAHVVYVASVLWYLTLSPLLGAVMAVLYALCFPLAEVTPWPVVVGIAVFGWLVQLAGHVVWEKKSPAFLTNLLQALIGPLFFVAVLLKRWPRRAPA